MFLLEKVICMNIENEIQEIEKRTDYNRIHEEFGISRIDKILPEIGREKL